MNKFYLYCCIIGSVIGTLFAELPATIQHKYMTPSMSVSTNAWLSVSNETANLVSGYLSRSGGTMTGDIKLEDGTMVVDEEGHMIIKSLRGKSYFGATNDHSEIGGKIVSVRPSSTLNIYGSANILSNQTTEASLKIGEGDKYVIASNTNLTMFSKNLSTTNIVEIHPDKVSVSIHRRGGVLEESNESTEISGDGVISKNGSFTVVEYIDDYINRATLIDGNNIRHYVKRPSETIFSYTYPDKSGTLLTDASQDFIDKLDAYKFYDWKTNKTSFAAGDESFATNRKSIAIGFMNNSNQGTSAGASSSIAIGTHAVVRPNATESIAIGANAVATAKYSVQIGQGENTVTNTLKFRNLTLINEHDKIPLSLHDDSLIANLTTVNAWQNYWSGDDVRVTVTNYHGAIDIPSLYIEQKMEEDDDHDEPWFKVVWDERTRWNKFLEYYNIMTNNVADRSWGIYDSSSGEYSPDGLLQLSQDQIMISSGMSYQKTVTAGGNSIWVLKATSPTTMSGVLTNGFFKIEDGDGNTLFEIVKGDKRIVGAIATSMQVDDGVMTIKYNSISSEHPTLEVASNLSTPDWKTETETTLATINWTGESGNWIATVTPNGVGNSMFVKGTFEAGGNTYIKNNVATSIDKVVIGGVEYTVTVETINGKKLMVLR